MSGTKELTYSDVSKHTSKTDLYVVIHDKVYNASSFIDEHPGGKDVLLDASGQDATDFFEDVGHSDEAREILSGLLIGNLKRREGDPRSRTSGRTTTVTTPKSEATGLGIGVYFIILVGGTLAFFAYQYLQRQNKS